MTDAERATVAALVEAAYLEGASHGESNACAYEWGSFGDSNNTWERSEAKAALEGLK